MYRMSSSSTPVKPNPEHQYRTLLTAKNRLEYLTGNDWALIADKSQRVLFKKDDVLIQSGRQPRHVYVIVSGRARIESIPGTKVAQVAEGEICGEMSFLEGSVASASVLADTEVETLAIEWTALQQLFELYPHLGSRFYRSLALNLSRRLRKQIVR
jgi:CRP-like cAMP-binding protein